MGQTQIASSKAQQYTFGCEAEVLIPRQAIQRLGIQVGSYHHGYPLPSPFPAGWKAERDGSVRTDLTGYEPVEVVSPILKGRGGIEELKQVALTLESLGTRINRTCGAHVHIGAASVAGADSAAIAEWVGRLLYQAAMHERALYASTGTHRRENGGYSRRIDHQKNLADLVRKAPKHRKDSVLRGQTYNLSRYYALNLTNLFGSKATVEFRWPAGTTSWVKMVAHVQQCLALAERATEQAKLDWEGIASERTYKQAGAGTRALDRFLYLAGWTKGRRDVGKPQVEMAGWIADLADLKAVKAELKRLARKYDRGAN
jgi:hypothetical protein